MLNKIAKVEQSIKKDEIIIEGFQKSTIFWLKLKLYSKKIMDNV